MTAFSQRFISLFNLRNLVLVAGLCLLFINLRPAWLNSLDNLLLDWGKALVHLSEPTLDLAVVQLSEAESELLHQDIGRLTELNRLLQQLVSAKRKVGIVLSEPLDDLPWVASEIQQAMAVEGVANASALNELQRYSTTAIQLHQALTQNNVVLGVASNSFSGKASDVTILPSYPAEFFNALPAFMRPSLPLVDLTFKSDIDPTNTTPIAEPPIYFPLSGISGGISSSNNYSTSNHYNNTASLPLLYRTANENQLLNSFTLDLYRRFANVASVDWQAYQNIQLDAIAINTSASAHIYPLYDAELRANHVKRYTVSEALGSARNAKLVIISELDDANTAAIVNGLLSIEHQQYLFEPYWFAAMDIALIIFALLFLWALLPKISLGVGLLASCLLVTLLVVLQLGWQITQNQYLPLGVVVSYLLAGYVIITLWKLGNERETQLIATAHGARYQLGLQLFRDGRSDDALLAVRECLTSEAVLALMYDIAAQQERKRHYSDAVKTYQAIVARKKGFRDAEQKVEKLMAFSSGGAASLGSSGDIAQTIIISETTINKPVLGRYEIERELGRGAMGVVYLGRDPKISRQVAIKTLSYGQLDPRQLDDFKTRFFREAEAAGRLNHPNIVTVYDVGEEHDLAFIAMDFVNGLSLASFIAQDQLLPVDEVCEVMAKVADALEYAHAHHIIHRDIKPGNIMYVPSTHSVKVTDFGVARIVDSAKTNTGDILGSPLYMSPEQLKGEKVSYPSDIYSLGVTFYQLLTGQLPFNGENLANLTYNIINEKYKGVRELRSELPKSLTRIINRALQKDPAKRYASAADFAKAIRNR